MKVNVNNILLKRASKGLTIKELSCKSGVQRQTISKIEKGQVNPNPATVGKLAKALNSDIIEFFSDDYK